MHPRRILAIACALLLAAAASLPGAAQNSFPPPPDAMPATQRVLNTPAQLDQLLAPIALYPDPLLGQILMASTYPLEVIQADRWVKDPNNAALKGDQLAAALSPIDWDPSVKSLVPFPQVLALMDERLDWMQKLGDAFLAQQSDVMDSVQRLRHAAQAAGTLQSTPQETVASAGPAITIQPASPTVIYVPVYNPAVVYGAWPYPDYPPIYLPPPPGFYLGPPVFAGITFSIGFGIIRAFWGWDDWDWDHRRLHVDANRYNVINNYFIEHDRRPPLRGDNWVHDPYHRRGAVYRDPQIRATYRTAPAGAPETRSAYRGFDRGAAVQPATRAPAATQARPAIEAGRAPAPRAAESRATETRPAARTQAAQPNVLRGAPAAQRPAAVAPRAAPPVFQGFGKGADAGAQAERGRASQQTITARPTAAPRANPPPAAARQPNVVRPPSDAGRGGGERPADNQRRQQR